MFQEEIMKKLLSLLLAAIMLFTLGFSAVADENDDPTTYLSIMNNDYESVIMTFNVNADKFVADTATYRVFSDVCFEDVVSDQGGSAFVNIYFYDEGGKYIAHSDWASSFQPEGEDGEWNDYEFSFSTADYQGFSYATIAVGLWKAKGTVRTSSIQLSKNGEIIWNRCWLQTNISRWNHHALFVRHASFSVGTILRVVALIEMEEEDSLMNFFAHIMSTI